MSNLSEQLHTLRVNHEAGSRRSGKIVSVYYALEDAKKIDDHSVFQLGYSGFQELQENEMVALKGKRLFSDGVAGRREMSADELVELDNEIRAFLKVLSDYFLTKSALKVFEYLLRRFEIHLYHVDALLLSNMKYFETDLFKKLLNMVNVYEDEYWHFVRYIGTPRVLLKSHLVNECVGNVKFLKHFGEHLEIQSYTSILMNVLEEKIGEKVVREILYQIKNGMLNGNKESQVSSFMLLMKLVCEIEVSKEAVREMMHAIMETGNSKGCVCIVSIVQRYHDVFNYEMVTRFIEYGVEKLNHLEYDILPLVNSIVTILLQHKDVKALLCLLNNDLLEEVHIEQIMDSVQDKRVLNVLMQKFPGKVSNVMEAQDQVADFHFTVEQPTQLFLALKHASLAVREQAVTFTLQNMDHVDHKLKNAMLQVLHIDDSVPLITKIIKDLDVSTVNANVLKQIVIANVAKWSLENTQDAKILLNMFSKLALSLVDTKDFATKLLKSWILNDCPLEWSVQCLQKLAQSTQETNDNFTLFCNLLAQLPTICNQVASWYIVDYEKLPSSNMFILQTIFQLHQIQKASASTLVELFHVELRLMSASKKVPARFDQVQKMIVQSKLTEMIQPILLLPSLLFREVSLEDAIAPLMRIQYSIPVQDKKTLHSILQTTELVVMYANATKNDTIKLRCVSWVAAALTGSALIVKNAASTKAVFVEAQAYRYTAFLMVLLSSENNKVRAASFTLLQAFCTLLTVRSGPLKRLAAFLAALGAAKDTIIMDNRSFLIILQKIMASNSADFVTMDQIIKKSLKIAFADNEMYNQHTWFLIESFYNAIQSSADLVISSATQLYKKAPFSSAKISCIGVMMRQLLTITTSSNYPTKQVDALLQQLLNDEEFTNDETFVDMLEGSLASSSFYLSLETEKKWSVIEILLGQKQLSPIVKCLNIDDAVLVQWLQAYVSAVEEKPSTLLVLLETSIACTITETNANLLAPLFMDVACDFNGSEFEMQLLFSALTNVVNALESPLSMKNVDVLLSKLLLVVQEGSVSPQTHHTTLLLLAALCRVYPKTVLAELMNFLESVTKSYAVDNLLKVVTTIVHHVETNSETIKLKTFLSFFVNMYTNKVLTKDVDYLNMYYGLLSSMKSENALSLFMRLFIDGNKKQAAFLSRLSCKFSPIVQLNGLVGLFHSVQSDSNHGDTDSEGDNSASILTYINFALNNQQFHLQLSDDTTSDDQFQSSYLEIIELCLAGLQADGNPQYYEIIKTVQGMLSTWSFIAVVQELLVQGDPSLQTKALEILNDRIVQQGNGFSIEEEALFMEMIDSFDLKDASDDHLQTSMLTLDILGRHFGEKHPKRFHAVVCQILSLLAKPEWGIEVVASGVICCSTLLCATTPISIQSLPNYLDILTEQFSSDNITMRQCVLTALTTCMSKFAPFLGNRLSNILQFVFGLEDSPAVQRLRCLIIENIEFRVLFPVMVQVEPECTFSENLIEFFTSMLEKLTSRSVLRAHLSSIIGFYFQIFQTMLNQRALVTSSILIRSFEVFMLKLNEKQLKPLFSKLVEWSNGTNTMDAAHISRKILFYHLVHQLSNTLKSIFVPYFGHLLTDTVELFNFTTQYASNENDTSGEEDSFFVEEDRPVKRMKTTKQDTSMKSLVIELVSILLQSYTSCFSYDSVDFVTQDRAKLLLSPMLDQMNVITTLNALDSLNQKYVSCMTNFAIAMKQDILWKPFHHQLLLKAQEDSVEMRVTTLQILGQCYSTIGEEFLTLLPESIPFLSEMLEDSSEEVKTTCQKIVEQIELLSGESLDDYFLH